MDNIEVKRKIEKLIKLSENNPNENERLSAFRMAKKLIKEYNLNERDFFKFYDIMILKNIDNFDNVRHTKNDISLYNEEHIETSPYKMKYSDYIKFQKRVKLLFNTTCIGLIASSIRWLIYLILL